MKSVDMYKVTHLGFLISALWMLFYPRLSQAQKDCTGVECEPLQNCIEEVLESGACCASCLKRGCTCEGYQYYDCVNVGFRNGKVPEGESYFVDFGSTECSCPKGGGKISCQFIPCPELPPNCIDVLQPADGCPQCGRIGCIDDDEKYVAGHTFHVPPCKVCHCPNSGGELMCYPLPECDVSTFNPLSTTEIEDIESEKHYSDPYSYDQDAPERDPTQLETPKKHRGDITSTEQEDSLEQAEDYAEPEKATAFPTMTPSVLPSDPSTISYQSDPSTQSEIGTISEEKESNTDLSVTEFPDIQDVSETDTPVSVPDQQEGNIRPVKETQQALVEPDTDPDGKQEERERIEEQEDPPTHVQEILKQEEHDGKDHSHALSKEATDTVHQDGRELPEEYHKENALPKVRFSPTTIPPVALKDHSEVADRQSQTLYQYEPEDDDPNSIHLASRLQEGSTKDVIETCCAAGQQWAVDNGECVDIPLSEADSVVCRTAQNHCCISYLKENSCVAGMIAAKEGDFCVTDEADTCGGTYYKQCCDCCTLGLRVKNEGQTCDLNPNLGYPCNQAMLSCCVGEDQLILPEIKRQPEPKPTPTPEKVAEPLEHEALSVDNLEDANDILTGDDMDECLHYPEPLCHHLCINTVGSYKCDCFPGFIMQEDGVRCKPENEDFEKNVILLLTTTAPELPQESTVQPTTIIVSQLQEDKCKDNGPCKHVCNTVEERIVCSCSPGYTLMIDGVSCEDINECVADSHTCQRGERCINTVGSFTCLKEVVCEPGYENKDDICVDINECERGTHNCKVNFVCQNSKGSFYCESKQRCMDGFIQDPEGNCVDVNECMSLPAPCKVGFNCINTVGSYTCQRNLLMCSRGYHSSQDGSRCIDVDECQTGVHRCGEAQVCHNLPGTYHCDCKMGYQLDAFSRTCIDINECWNYPGRLCQHTCENTPGSYRCSCSSGFRLAYDGKHCEDVNECENNPCSQECANVYGSYQCYCRQGYQLAEDGHSCKDIDECLPSGGTICTFRCVNVPGSYQCACPDQGYTMGANGRTCKDIDECAIGSHNCSTTESCYNIQGSYRCLSFVCPENYRKVADMRCERISCLNYLDCQNTPVRITYYQLTFPSNIIVPSHIFRIGPMPAYAGDNIILEITKGNEENYFSTRKLNQYTGIVFIQRQIKEPKDFLLDVEMKLWRQGTYTTFVARIYVFITDQSF